MGAGCYPAVPGPFYIRIFPHVIRASPNGSGGQSDVAIKQAIEIMRADFAAHNIFFVWDDCEINVIADNDLYVANAPSLDGLYSTYGNPNGINLFFFPTDQGMGEVALGRAIFSGKALYIGGEEEQWDEMVYSAMESRILSHEMGHCLGLFHTHQQNPDRFPNNNIYCCDNHSGERADGSNGCECGDYVQDTPAFFTKAEENVVYPDCNFTTTVLDCAGGAYNPDEKNIMGYTYQPCKDSFSVGQGVRMRWVISQEGTDPAEPTLTGILATGVFENLSITTSDVWDLNDFPGGVVSINQSLTIEPGVNLLISSVITVQFAANASLHIKPNALLELDGTLTGLCGSPWRGVFVWGDCSKGQQPVNGVYAQGRFNGKSNGIIENAQSAVRNFGPNGDAGGQIRCTGTTFRNNLIGVVFREYINRAAIITSSCTPAGLHLDDVSTLDRCKFETNNDYSIDLGPFDAFIDLRKVRGVKIRGCNFSNLKSIVDCNSGINDKCYGYGIKSFNAGFRLQNSLSGGGATTKFKGLSYGIKADISALSRPITINAAEFTDCYKGIYASQTTGIDISSCKFFMGKVPNPAVSDRQFGSILFKTSVYKYRFNKAFGPPINVEKTVGTCVNDCGELNNVVFKNTYDNVMIGNVANLLNAGGLLTEPRGLLYECNTNTGVYGFDFTQPAAGDVVRQLQGYAPVQQGDPFTAAGNKFSYNPAVIESDFSYKGGGALDYRYLFDNPNIQGDERQQPFDFVGLQTTAASTNLSCGTWPDGEQPLLSSIELQNEKNRYYSNRTAYLQAKSSHTIALQSGNTTLAAQFLERASYHRFEMDESASDVLYNLMRDTLSLQRDSVRNWMLHLETFGADIAVVLDDLDAGESTKAQTVYNAIPNRFALTTAQQQDYNQFGIIVSFLSTQSIQTLDASSQQVLLGVAQQPAGIAAQTAKSILSHFGFEFESSTCALPECCQFGQGGTERNQIQQSSTTGLDVYPNPANSEVTFELVNHTLPVQLTIFNHSGKLVWQCEFQRKVVWLTQNHPAGLYFYTLQREGKKLQSGKVSIIH
jgi:hypothetical protein